MTETLKKLEALISERRGGDHKKSYTAKLFKRGRGKISQKLGEESVETIIAALSETKENTVEESADLLYHLMVLWADCDIDLDEVMDVLDYRMNQSGLDEKAARKAK